MSATISSTGACPAEWRKRWRAEAERVGSTWRQLLDCAEAVLSRLRDKTVSDPWDSGWREAAEKYHRDRAGRVLIVEPSEITTHRDRAAKSTVEALTFALRSRGTAALTEHDTQRRLRALSDQQAIEVGNRLQKLNPEIAPAWTPDEVEILFQARSR